MSAPLIGDLREPPTVGKFYMVPFVNFVWMNIEADWPVLGPMHTDADFFAFPERHYHVDVRFVTSRLARRIASSAPSVAGTAQAYPLAKRWGDSRGLPSGRPQLRRFRCRTSSFDYEFGDCNPIRRLREHYGRPADPIRLRDGRVLCPHRKLDLTQFQADADGIVTCPLHGLRVKCAPEVVL